MTNLSLSSRRVCGKRGAAVAADPLRLDAPAGAHAMQELDGRRRAHLESPILNKRYAHLDENGIKPRSNAVIACDLVLSVSTPSSPRKVTRKRRPWTRRRSEPSGMPLSFLKEQFGSRIIAAVLHLDEYTPHLQAIVVPLIIPEEPEEKVRLSARDLFSRENLIALQQAWEDALRPLGVGQRTKRSDLHHVDAKRYGGCIAAIRRADPSAEITIKPPAPKILESAHAYAAWVKPAKVKEKVRLKRKVEPLLRLALDGNLLRASFRDGNKLRRGLRQANKIQADVQAHNERLRIELEQYCPPSKSAVAAALGVSSLDTTMSPITAVMQHKRTNRNQALLFLATTFGSEAAANLLREEVVLNFRKLDLDRAARTWLMSVP